MEVFFDAAADSKLNGILLNTDESRHALKVLRYETGNEIWLTNGRGVLFRGTFKEVVNNRMQIEDLNVKSIEPRPVLSLAVSPLKKPARNEFMLEKATEAGVKSIHFFNSGHTIKPGVRMDRAEKTVLAALKQSGNLFLPKIHPPLPLEKIFSNLSEEKKLVACRDADGSIPIWDAYVPGEQATLFIGPEGDFSKKEILSAKEHNAIPVWLGPKRYRSETAAIMAIFYLNMLNYQAGIHNNRIA